MELNKTSGASAPVVPLAIVAVVLQLLLSPQFVIFGGQINFMLVLVVVLSFTVESRHLVYVGFFGGLFYGLVTTAPVGLMALLLTVAAYVAGALFRGLTANAGVESLRSAVILILGVNLVNGIALFAMGMSGNLLVSLGVHGLASTVLDLIACVPFLFFLGRSGSSHGFSAHGGRGKGGLGTLHPGARGSRYKGIR